MLEVLPDRQYKFQFLSLKPGRSPPTINSFKSKAPWQLTPIDWLHKVCLWYSFQAQIVAQIPLWRSPGRSERDHWMKIATTILFDTGISVFWIDEGIMRFPICQGQKRSRASSKWKVCVIVLLYSYSVGQWDTYFPLSYLSSMPWRTRVACDHINTYICSKLMGRWTQN